MPGKAEIKQRLRGLLDPVVSILSSLGVSPMAVSIFGLLLSLVGAVFIARTHLFGGALFLLASGLCDTIDGSLARKEDRVTTFGAFFDSTVDRITELAYFGALILYYAGLSTFDLVITFFVIVALGGSFLTSYTRARAEGLDMECQVGWIERPERLALLFVGLLFGRVVLSIVIIFLAFLTTFTFIQRILHVRRLSAQRDQSP